MADQDQAEELKKPWFFGMYPAATKKTGSYLEPPVFEPIQKREDESWEAFRAREKKERKRRPRPRKKKGGWCFAFPDICKVPSDPDFLFPFPNMSFLKDAVRCIATVKVEGKPVIVQTSEIPNSTGDEFGRKGGMLSGTVADKTNFLQYSSKVYIKGKAVVYLGCRTAQNNYNTVGKFVKPAQKKVWVAP